MFSGTAQISHHVCQFFFSYVFLIACVAVVYINNAVGFRK
jgi:hypothetical protein